MSATSTNPPLRERLAAILPLPFRRGEGRGEGSVFSFRFVRRKALVSESLCQSTSEEPAPGLSEDEQTLRRLGYKQELSRRMSPFSNFAISVSIICILAGGITSFQYGFCSVGGASIGLGWPLVCLFSMTVALS